ncbi:MAG: type II secretion system F family protein [Armatimonadetes bacterium]|nr:type II secretion system F family protein [Armatimonadota bacterium]
MQTFATPLVIAIWLGFLACIGILLSARFARAGFQRRLQQTLQPDEEEVDELLEEKQREEMSKSFVSRTLGPITQKMGRRFRGSAKAASGAQVRDMLEQAGHPMGMHYPEFLGLKMFCLLALTGVGFLSSFVAVPLIIQLGSLPADPTTNLMLQGLWVLIFAYVGFSGPTFWLRKTVNKRIKQIRKSMADVVDLIVLAIEAGLGFDQAVGQAVVKTKGPLSEELGRVLDEIRVGKPQGDAFRDMAKRVRMSELTLLVAAIDQATRMGTGLVHALRLQATEIRERRMAYIREQAGKLPVKMMLPLVFCIFPALFVVILGPAGVKMVEMSARGELGM